MMVCMQTLLIAQSLNGPNTDPVPSNSTSTLSAAPDLSPNKNPLSSLSNIWASVVLSKCET